MAPHGYWASFSNNLEEQKKFIQWMEKELKIVDVDDWYRVSFKQIRQLAPLSNLETKTALLEILMRVYPNHNWNEQRMSRVGPKKASQRVLVTAVKELLQNTGAPYDKQHLIFLPFS
jgi:hypothetical protein